MESKSRKEMQIIQILLSFEVYKYTPHSQNLSIPTQEENNTTKNGHHSPCYPNNYSTKAFHRLKTPLTNLQSTTESYPWTQNKYRR